MKTYGVIMAGGGGTRFWPLSRMHTPKQLLNMSGKEIMINETIDRLDGLIDQDSILIVTNQSQAAAMEEAVAGRVTANRILREPIGRNTAACIGYGAMEIMKKYGDGIMCVFPSDHYIKDQKAFRHTLGTAIEAATKEEVLVTIGINPSFPATGYGYIRYGDDSDGLSHRVESFVEKPSLALAQSYLAEGGYVWNSGMFVWKASTILAAFDQYLPHVMEYLRPIYNAIGTDQEEQVIEELYPKIPSVSIDYGIMEKSDAVRVVPGEFGWNDVGSWDAFDALHVKDGNGNVILGQQVNLDTSNCIIVGNKRLITTVGIEDLIIVETEDAILVSAKSRAQDVKCIVEELRSRQLTKYLD